MNMKELFSKKQPDKEKQIGEIIPEPYQYSEDSSKDKVYCLISLTCMHCVDLLPYLNNFASSYSGELYLLCNCTSEEMTDLIQYFDYKFKLIQVTEEDIFQNLGIKQTPYAMHLSNQFEVLNESIVYNDDDMRRLVGER